MGSDHDSSVVGRERELEAVEAFLTEGLGALVLEGEPGIGKTTVWSSAVAWAASRRVLLARPAEAETRLPFATLTDLLEPALDDAIRSMPGPQRRALEVALALREPESAFDERVVAAAALTALRTLAEDGPVLLGVDDLQWVDRPSASVLAYALRRLGDDRVQLLGTRRTGSEGGLALREETRIAVGPLAPEVIGRIVRSRLGLDLRRPALLRITARAGGNPFYALELARDGRLADDTDAPLPSSLGAALRKRLADAPPPTRAALNLAAAHPAPTPELLERAGAPPAALEDAIARDLLSLEGDGLRFTHPLIASAALGTVTPARRREIHRRLAAAIDDADERAPHLARATTGADEAIASELEAAAFRAMRRGAPAEGAELAQHAVRLTSTTDDAAVRRRTVALAELLTVAGEGEAASRLIERLVAQTSPGPERARLLLQLAEWAWFDFDRTARICQEAIAEADSAGRALGLLFLSNVVRIMGRGDEAVRLLEEAVPLAEAVGDERTLRYALTELASTRWSRGEGIAEDLLRRAAELHPAEERPVSLEVYPGPELLLAQRLMIAGELDRARPLFDLQAERARGLGDERVLADVLGMLANLECRAGHAELARRHADAAVEMVRSIQEPVSLAFVLYWSGRVRALLGLVDDAHADIEEAIEASERVGHKLFRICCVDVLGYLALATGQLDAAQDHLESVLDGVREVRWREPAALDAFQHLAEVHVVRGDLERAETVLDDLESRLSPASGVRPRAGGVRVRGLLAAARRDAGAAVALLEESIALQARLPEPHESGRTLLHLGAVLRRANRRRPAREALEKAVRVLDGCGARLWAEQARSELDRIGGRPVRTGSLTPTEQQIADLVAAGRSNHEVARALSLSPKTVEWNLSKIYRKLHVRSRSELGAKLRGRRAEAV